MKAVIQQTESRPFKFYLSEYITEPIYFQIQVHP